MPRVHLFLSTILFFFERLGVEQLLYITFVLERLVVQLCSKGYVAVCLFCGIPHINGR